MFKDKKKVWIFVSLSVLLALIALDSYFNPVKDFNIFIGASKLLLEEKSCYNVWIQTGQIGLLYYYSPFFALVLTPLTYLPEFLYNCIWLSANVYFCYRMFWLINCFLGVSNLAKKWLLLYYILAIICSARFLHLNFKLGQMTIFLIYASLESIHLINNKKPLWGAVLLALAINIKLLPLALLFYLIYRKEFKPALWVIFFFVIFLFVPAVFFGFDFNLVLLKDWTNLLAGTSGNSIMEDIKSEGISPLLSPYLMISGEGISLNLSLLNTALVINAVKLLFVVFTIYFLDFRPFQMVRNRLQNFYAIAYILLITPLIAPHQRYYSFLYVLPAFCYVFFVLIYIWQSKKGFGSHLYVKAAFYLTVLSFALTTLTTDGIIGREYYDIANHYHLMTIGTIVLIVPMFILAPKRIAEIMQTLPE